MLCCGASDNEEKQANRLVDNSLKASKKQEDRIVKLLLLGAGESGKSTIFKQMKLLYGEKSTEEELRVYTKIVYSNVLVAMKTLLDQANKWNMINSVQDQNAIHLIDQVDESSMIDNTVGTAIKKLWSDPVIQEVWNRRSEFQVVDSMAFFFKDIDRIMKSGYVATEEDNLYCRVRTTGVVTTKYNIAGVPFEMYDVGGQRNERRKWIHFFENVTAVIFVAALSEYDQVLFEDSSKNRVEEALDLFEEICNLEFFAKSSILLFLNKHDLFEEKIRTRAIRSVPNWADYNGNTLADAEEYFKAKFLAKNHSPERSIFTRFTTATNTSNVEFVFNAARSIILDQNVGASGF